MLLVKSWVAETYEYWREERRTVTKSTITSKSPHHSCIGTKKKNFVSISMKLSIHESFIILDPLLLQNIDEPIDNIGHAADESCVNAGRHCNIPWSKLGHESLQLCDLRNHTLSVFLDNPGVLVALTTTVERRILFALTNNFYWTNVCVVVKLNTGKRVEFKLIWALEDTRGCVYRGIEYRL